MGKEGTSYLLEKVKDSGPFQGVLSWLGSYLPWEVTALSMGHGMLNKLKHTVGLVRSETQWYGHKKYEPDENSNCAII